MESAAIVVRIVDFMVPLEPLQLLPPPYDSTPRGTPKPPYRGTVIVTNSASSFDTSRSHSIRSLMRAAG